MAHRWRVVLIGCATGILILYLVGWYALRDPDRFLPHILADAQNKTGLQIRAQHIKIRLFPRVSVRVYGLEVKNPKPFPDGDFLKVPMAEVTVALMPLLQRKIEIHSMVLDRPTIDFISDPDGLWNFQNPAAPKQQRAHFSLGGISDLRVRNGTLLGSNLIDPADTPGPIVLELHNVSGELKQIKFQPSGQTNSMRAIRGKLAADTARFGDIYTTDLHSQLQITQRELTFKNFHTKTYRGKASGDFSFQFGRNTTFQTTLRVSGIGMPYLLVEFGQGSRQSPKMTGMMQAKLDLAGQIEHTSNPLAAMHGTGDVTVRDGELPSLNRNTSMEQIKRFRNSAGAKLPPSAFSSFSGDMELKNRRIYSKRVSVDFYGVEVKGSGSMSVAGGPLDYRGTATILKKQGFFTSLFARWFKGAKEHDGRLTFPIRLKGTLANPKFSVVH